MYKKIALLSIMFYPLTQYAWCQPLLEIKPSYFFFSSSSMNTIYDNGGFEVQASLATSILSHLDFYTSVGCRRLRGSSLSAQEKTTVTVVPIDIGLKPTISLSKCFDYFCAIGPRYFYFKQRNNSLTVNRIITGSGVGFFVNTGFNLLFAENFVFGFFGEYSYEKTAFYSTMPDVYSNGSVQIGGIALGLSAGYIF